MHVSDYTTQNANKRMSRQHVPLHAPPHEEHTDAPTCEYDIGGHGEHAVAFAALKVLTLHATDGAVRPVVEHAYPAVHGEGADAPARQKAPSGHATCRAADDPASQ
jgi:hypothetical protein